MPEDGELGDGAAMHRCVSAQRSEPARCTVSLRLPWAGACSVEQVSEVCGDKCGLLLIEEGADVFHGCVSVTEQNMVRHRQQRAHIVGDLDTLEIPLNDLVDRSSGAMYL